MTVRRVEVLGAPRVVVDGVGIEVRSRQQQAILAMLATADRRRMSAAAIVDRLWPDAVPQSARKSVQVLVGRLRQALDDTEAICFDAGAYGLDPSIAVDIDEFEQELALAAGHARQRQWREARELAEHALERWHGQALGSCAEELWAMPIAADLEHRRADAVELALEASVQLGDHDHVVARMDAAVASHPERARLQANRIIALARSGLQGRALDACRAAIEGFTGAERDRFQQLQRRLLAQDPELVDAPRRSRFDLPQPPRATTSLVGRAVELSDLAGAIRSGSRIITIVGPGGTGKSRLVAELVRERSRHFDDVAWIDLAETSDAGAVPATVQRQLGIVGGDADPAETIAAALGGRRVLVCFDNFEHVLDARSLVTQLVERTDRVVFVQTSREPLRIDGEQVIELPALRRDEDALALFVARAESAGGQVGPDDAGVVLELCDLVDRLPLGIELAAARTSLLTPEQVLDRLRDRFDLLRTRDARVPSRQRSLVDVVAWSIDLLDDEDRRMLAALSLFVGGATIGAAATVAGVTHAAAAASIDRLVGKSLVVDGHDRLGQRRVTLLETVRQVAADLCEPDAIERFSEYAQAIVSPAMIPRVVDQDVRARIAVEAPNLLAAVDADLGADVKRAAWILGGLADHFQTSGSLGVAERYVRRVLEQVGESRSEEADAARYTALCVLPLRGGAAGLIDDLRRALPRIDRRGVDLGRLYRCAIAEAYRHAGETDAALDVLGSADGRSSVDVSAAAARVSFVRGCCMADAGRLLEAEQEFAGLDGVLAACGDVYWAYNAEVCFHINCDGGAMAVEVVPRLDEIARWMVEHRCRSYAAYVEAMAARCLFEHGRLEECLQRSEACLEGVARAGDLPLLTYSLGLFSLAAWEDGRPLDAASYAVRALEHAARSGFTWCAEYSTFVLADLARSAGDEVLFSAAVDAIDFDALDDRFRPDRIIASAYPDRSAATAGRARQRDAYVTQLSELARSWRRSRAQEQIVG